jgi:hypothetical protein
MLILFDESNIVKGPSPISSSGGTGRWILGGMAILSALFHRIGRPRQEIHLFRWPSEGHGVVLPTLAGDMGGHRKQPRSRKDLPGAVAMIEGDPDREPAIGSEASGDRDQAHRYATPLQPLLGRQDLMGAPEDEDQDRIRRAGQLNSFALPSIRMVSLETHRRLCVMPLISRRGYTKERISYGSGVGSSMRASAPSLPPPEPGYNHRMTVPAFPLLAQAPSWALMALIGGAALAVNIPLGYAREGFRRFSIGWFVCVHLSVPLIAWLRLANHVSAWGIPAFVACAVLGQIAGGKLRRIDRARP